MRIAWISKRSQTNGQPMLKIQLVALQTVEARMQASIRGGLQFQHFLISGSHRHYVDNE